MTDKELYRIAKDMTKMSYAPFSKFCVGAALECKDGTIYTGCNVENAAYPLCTCAERTAFAKAVSEGARAFSAIVICGRQEGGEMQYCPPCGVCRQVMSEFCGPDFQVILAVSPECFEVHTLAELLPLAFSL
jgi:cytidine deaminase